MDLGCWEGNPLEGGGEVMTEFEANVLEAALMKGVRSWLMSLMFWNRFHGQQLES